MSKVITFSRVFPAYHPKSGQPTYFVEKIWSSIQNFAVGMQELKELDLIPINANDFKPKHHTIRCGNRWKVGDKFSPRVWSGKPYRSKMITIASDVEVKKVWQLEIKNGNFYINGKTAKAFDILEISENDGFSGDKPLDDLLEWFQYPKPFKGQIICWNESINY